MNWGFSNFDYTSTFLAATATVTVLAVMPPTVLAARPQEEIARVAQDTTVEINNSAGEPGGTGVIISKKDNVYTVLTANHVVGSTDAQYTVRTRQNKEYPANVQRLQTSKDAPDLAVVTFTTADVYAAATMGNSDRTGIGSDIYVCGFPLPSSGNSKERVFQFTKGIVASRLQSGARGYTLRYDAITRKGMSGGPVFDVLGRVVGIHGEADIDGEVTGDTGQTVAIKTGINAGIPINIFLGMKSGTDTSSAVVDNTPTGEDPAKRISNPQTAGDFSFRGIVRQQEGNTQAAIEDFNKAIALDPNDALSYYKRGIARYNQGDRAGANEDFTKVINISPDYLPAYFNRGLTRQALQDFEGMRSDFDRVISLGSNEAEAYNNRAVARSALGDRDGAIADLTQVIRLRPNLALAYNNRARLRSRQGDKQGALADFTESIRLSPDNAVDYYNRGLIRNDLGDRQGAIADLQKAVELFQKQGDTNNYQKAQERLIRMQAAPPSTGETNPSGNSPTPASNPGETPKTNTSGNAKNVIIKNHFIEKLKIFTRGLFIWK